MSSDEEDPTTKFKLVFKIADSSGWNRNAFCVIKPDTTLLALRVELAQQLDEDWIPSDYCFRYYENEIEDYVDISPRQEARHGALEFSKQQLTIYSTRPVVQRTPTKCIKTEEEDDVIVIKDDPEPELETSRPTAGHKAARRRAHESSTSRHDETSPKARGPKPPASSRVTSSRAAERSSSRPHQDQRAPKSERSPRDGFVRQKKSPTDRVVAQSSTLEQNRGNPKRNARIKSLDTESSAMLGDNESANQDISIEDDEAEACSPDQNKAKPRRSAHKDSQGTQMPPLQEKRKATKRRHTDSMKDEGPSNHCKSSGTNPPKRQKQIARRDVVFDLTCEDEDESTPTFGKGVSHIGQPHVKRERTKALPRAVEPRTPQNLRPAPAVPSAQIHNQSPETTTAGHPLFTEEAFLSNQLFHVNPWINCARQTNEGFGIFIAAKGVSIGFCTMSPIYLGLQEAGLQDKEICKTLQEDHQCIGSDIRQVSLWHNAVKKGDFIIMRHQYGKCPFMPDRLKINGKYIGPVYVLGVVTEIPSMNCPDIADCVVARRNLHEWREEDLKEQTAYCRVTFLKMGKKKDLLESSQSYLNKICQPTVAQICKLGASWQALGTNATQVRQDLWRKASTGIQAEEFNDDSDVDVP